MQNQPLEVTSLNALAGADQVRTRVLAALSLGASPTVDRLAYQIKCRVKAHESLVKKVIDRQKKKPEYQPSDVRDIVGLRLLSLFRRDLPALVSRFLSFISAGQSEHLSLFIGSELQDCIEEIIIYTTRAEEHNDTIDNQLVDLFVSKGLADGPKSSSKTKVRFKIERKETKYSSIHLIVWCSNSLSSQQKHRIPMEVQIRTPLEDVWGEIDHGLRYKGNDTDHDEASQVHLEYALRDLELLKDSLDNCTRSADSIAERVYFSRPAAQAVNITLSSFSINLGALVDLPLPEADKIQLKSIQEQIQSCYTKIGQGNFSRLNGGAKGLADLFAGSAEKLQKLGESFIGPDNSIDDENVKTAYHLLMEAALCYYWSGRILTAAKNSTDLSEEIYRRCSKSLNIYARVGSSLSSKNDAMVSYRTANVLSALGQDDLALEKFKEAVEDLSSPQDYLPEKHFLRVRIPRQLGVAYWERAEKLKSRAVAVGLDDMFIERRRSLYLDALRVTLPLLDKSVDPPPELITIDAEEMAPDRSKTENNILEFSLCFKRAGGSLTDLEKLGVTTAQLEGIIDNLTGSEGVTSVEIPVWVDTLRAAYAELLGDEESARNCARRVISLIEGNRDRWVARNGEGIVQEMLDDAYRTLNAHGSQQG